MPIHRHSGRFSNDSAVFKRELRVGNGHQTGELDIIPPKDLSNVKRKNQLFFFFPFLPRFSVRQLLIAGTSRTPECMCEPFSKEWDTVQDMPLSSERECDKLLPPLHARNLLLDDIMNNPSSQTTLLHRRRTKIVATVGPASRDPAMLEALLRRRRQRLPPEPVARRSRRPPRPLRATSAPCPRRSANRSPSSPTCAARRSASAASPAAASRWRRDRPVTVTTRDVLGEPGLIPSQYAASADDVRPGDRILLDDGMLELRVDAVAGSEIACTVTAGGILEGPQGHEPARRAGVLAGPDRQGPRRRSLRPRPGRRFPGPVVRAPVRATWTTSRR